jgi:thiol-disulfide isomerase/thioredoxin
MMAAAGAADQVFDLSGQEQAVVPFTTEAAARRLAAAGPTVYFFAANWCPTCRAAFRDIAAKFRDFPPGFSLVVVNYDTAKELKAAYAVVYQHTFVRIDADGRALKTWSGSPTVADIVAQAGGR